VSRLGSGRRGSEGNDVEDLRWVGLACGGP
jgi:hypothetical protein